MMKLERYTIANADLPWEGSSRGAWRIKGTPIVLLREVMPPHHWCAYPTSPQAGH